MIELHSLEAEHGLLGAMMLQPHLIDVLSDGLSADAFAWSENSELFRLILEMHDESKPIDVITLSDRAEFLADGIRTLAYAGEVMRNTPGVANAKQYAKIVRERAIARQIASVAAAVDEIAREDCAVEDKIAQAQAAVMALDTDGGDSECQSMHDMWAEHIEVLQTRLDRFSAGITIDGLTSGIPDLDEYTQGMKPGQMIVVAGRPAMGKTTLAMNIAADVGINQKKPVLVISLEMSKTQLIDRLLAAVGGIPLPSLKTGQCASDYSTELAAAGLKLQGSKIVVSDVPVMSMPRIRSIARRQKHRLGGMGLIVIDYLGLVEGDSGSRTEDVTAMSRQIKLLAREIGCPVLILSQLNRSCEARPDKRPILSDLRESGAIEQDADMVMFVYRDEVYYPNSDQKGIGEILIRKNRDGETGSVRTEFQGEKSRFVPISGYQQKQSSSEDW